MNTDSTPRRSIFAVWHWPRWVWVVIVPLLFLTYILSAGPVMYAHDRMKSNSAARQVSDIVYEPVWWAYENNPLVEEVIESQYNWLCEWFGDP